MCQNKFKVKNNFHFHGMACGNDLRGGGMM